MIVVVIIGVLAAIAGPAFSKYLRRARTTEAITSLERIASGAQIYYYQAGRTPSGIPMLKRFPASIGRTPKKWCCNFSEKVCDPGEYISPLGQQGPNDRDWNSPTWTALSFSLGQAHYYNYRFNSSGKDKNARFVARAIGDLDCDGIRATYTRRGAATTEGGVNIGVTVVDSNYEIE